MVDGGLHLVQQVTGQQHRPAPVGEVAQQPAHPGDALGIQPVRRFVQDEHLRLTDERLGDAEPLPHAEGIAAHPAIGGVGQPDEVQQVLHPPRVDARHPRGDRQGRAPGSAGVHRGRVEQRADHPGRVGQLDERAAVDGRRSRDRVARARRSSSGSWTFPRRWARGSR